jgi:predicted P-loop ATPase
VGQVGPGLPDGNTDLFKLQRPEQAERFLQLLGKDPARTWFRTITPGKGANLNRKGADLRGLDLAALTRDNTAGASVYLVVGEASSATGKGGGVTDADIETIPALFVEWDDMPMQWQLTAWQTLSLPEPSVMVGTGGKSAHCYWLLDQPLPPDQWRALTARLIDYCNSDKQCCNPSRVMRLPGFAYIDKATGKPTGTIAEILHESDNRYSAAEIEACIPAPEQQTIPNPSTTSSRTRDLPPRGLDQIRAAADCIPARVPGNKTYDKDRRALCGCAAALAEIGLPEEQALDLLASKWPSRAEAQQVLSSSTTRAAGSFWGIAAEHGFDLRHRPEYDSLDGFEVHGDNTTPPAPAPTEKRHRLTHDEVMELLPRRVGQLRLNVRSGEVETDTGTISSNQISRLYLQLSSRAETWPKEPTSDAVALLASQAPFDPVAEYLQANTVEALPLEQWERLDQHLLGTDDPIAAAFLPRYLVSAVARVFEPSCDVRQLPVLVGPQWRGKTALGRILFGAQHWVEGIGDLGKDDLMKAHTSWGVELAELDGVTRRADQERLKAFLTETCDTYRKPYDRAPERHPRRFVFWGTSNGPPLRDATGSTRFVVIPLPDRMLPLDWAQEHRDAIWARALQQYKTGVQWSDCSEAERQAIAERNSNYQEIDPWAEDLGHLLENWPLISPGEPLTSGSAFDRLQIPKERRSNAIAARIRNVIEAHGWRHERRIVEGKKLTGFWPPAKTPPGHPGHPGHPADTPRGVRSKPSEGAGSDASGHPGHPNFEKVGKKERGVQSDTEQQRNTHASDFCDVWGVRGVQQPEKPAVAVDLTGHPTGCPRGVHGVSGVSGQLLGIGDLVEVANRAYAPKGVFEVIEVEGDKLLIQGPEGHANPMTISIPAAQCEVVF